MTRISTLLDQTQLSTCQRFDKFKNYTDSSDAFFGYHSKNAASAGIANDNSALINPIGNDQIHGKNTTIGEKDFRNRKKETDFNQFKIIIFT
jgi:hypothetical protein